MGYRRFQRVPVYSMCMSPNKTKLTGPPPPSIAKIDARAGGSG